MKNQHKIIAVNTRFLLANKLEGIGRFTYETLKIITQNHPEHQFIFLFDRPFSEKFIFAKNVTPVVISPPARHPFLWYLWFEWAVPRALKKVKADVFLSTDGYCSLKTKVPTAVVLHDLAFEHFPEQVPYLVRKYYQHFTPKFAQKAHQIATVSHFTKQDIVKQYGIPPDKITVTPNGVNAIFHPLDEPTKAQIKATYTAGCDYFLFVGAIHPRKNLANQLRAFEAFKTRRQGANEVKFVVAGRKAWQSKEAFQVYERMRYQEDVLFLGHLPFDTLTKIYGAALALSYVSHFEGFGIPIVEAMRSHVPVITSNVSSMPEVAGEAALLVTPSSVVEITEAMDSLFQKPELRQELIQKGIQQYQQFTWQHTAEQLWSCVEKLLDGKTVRR